MSQGIGQEEMILGQEEMIRVSGVSYRQLDHWTRQGYLLTIKSKRIGSGTKRLWQEGEDDVALVLHALVLSGMKPDRAADVVRALVLSAGGPWGTIDIVPGVRLTIKLEALRAGVTQYVASRAEAEELEEVSA